MPWAAASSNWNRCNWNCWWCGWRRRWDRDGDGNGSIVMSANKFHTWPKLRQQTLQSAAAELSTASVAERRHEFAASYKTIKNDRNCIRANSLGRTCVSLRDGAGRGGVGVRHGSRAASSGQAPELAAALGKRTWPRATCLPSWEGGCVCVAVCIA